MDSDSGSDNRGGRFGAVTRLALLAALVSLPTAAAGAEEAPPDSSPGWSLVTRENDVTVWQREAGSKFPVMHGTATIDAPLCAVLAVIRDVDRHTEWMHDCTEARWVEKKDPDTADIYNRTKGYRWIGVQDRDVVMRVVVGFRAAEGKAPPGVDVRFENVDRPDLEPLPGVTRMPTLKGYYRLQTVPESRGTRVDYRVDADIGGSAPAWIVSKTVESIPLHTLVNLREQVRRARPAEVYGTEVGACQARLAGTVAGE